MNLKAIITLILSLLFFFGANKWYNSYHEGLCCQEETVVAPPVEVEKERDPLMFKWNDPTTITNAKTFPGLHSSIVAGNKDGQILQITGKYFEGEVAPAGSGHADMGIARANAIWSERFSEIPKERIEFLSEKVAMRDGVKTNEFTNAGFRWIAATPATVEELPDGVIVRFPYNATQKTVDAAIDARLRKIAQRLKQNPNEKVSISGHTDSDGEAEANMKLGDRRAKTVRDILRSYGVERNRITTVSKGETQHVQPNTTDRGKAANRRAEVRIIQ